VNCSSCGQELQTSDAVCSNCGQPVAPAASTFGGSPSGRPGGASRPAPPLGNYKFDRARWSPTDLVAGVATLVLFISLFMPWYGVSIGPISVTADATAHGYMYIPLILCIAELAYLVGIAGLPDLRTRLPLPHETFLTTINAINLVLVVIGFLDKSGAGWRFGAFIGLIAAIVAALPKVALTLSARARKG
jgi:hypothetical protein